MKSYLSCESVVEMEKWRVGVGEEFEFFIARGVGRRGGLCKGYIFTTTFF